MKNRYFIMITIATLTLVALSVVNVFLYVKDRGAFTKRVEHAIADYRLEDKKVTDETINQALATVRLIPGRDGKDGQNGVTTVIERRVTAQEATAPPPLKGDRGEPGKDGLSARQVVLSTDPETGDVVWKYEDDTLWTLLIEKCQLTNMCEGDN